MANSISGLASSGRNYSAWTPDAALLGERFSWTATESGGGPALISYITRQKLGQTGPLHPFPSIGKKARRISNPWKKPAPRLSQGLVTSRADSL